MFETEIPPKQEPKGSLGLAMFFMVSGLCMGSLQVMSYFWNHNSDRLVSGLALIVVGSIALKEWRGLVSKPTELPTIRIESIEE